MEANNRADLQISEDLAYQQRTWFVERVGWAALALFIAAAVLGVFGGGVLGSASAVTPDGSLSLRYDRFWRQQSPTELRLEVSPPVSGSRLRIWISREYIERVNISQIMPAPESVEISSDRVVLEFSVGDSPERVPIMLRIEPLVPWRTPGRLGIDGGGGLSFAQFIYP